MPEKSLPAGRAGRLWQLGRLAGGIASGALGEGARQVRRGQAPVLQEMLLTPANLARIRDRLSEMRGAAMKVGQLLSMESGEFLPPELARLFDQLREQAHVMPLGEVAQLLRQNWGEGWEKRFQRFNFTPIAAASIGQVHEARTRDGHHLAIKLQYPGVRQSIDSDIDNIAMLLRWSGALPKGLDLQPLLQEARRQLHREADYQAEAGMLSRFASLLAEHERVGVPTVYPELCSEQVLAMRFMDGEPIESLASQPRAQREELAGLLLQIALREVFDWGLVQTDPNFANFRYQRESRTLQLLDFGACREYSATRREALRSLLIAALSEDREALVDACVQVGYLAEGSEPAHLEGVLDLLRGAFEPLRCARYDFAASDLARHMSEKVLRLRRDQGFVMLPPPDVLFLHRKLGGLYLLFSRLNVSLPVRTAIQRLLDGRGRSCKPNS